MGISQMVTHPVSAVHSYENCGRRNARVLKSGLKRHKGVKYKDTRKDYGERYERGNQSDLTLVGYSRIDEKPKLKLLILKYIQA